MNTKKPLLALVTSTLLALAPGSAHALSCSVPPLKVFSVFDNGSYIDGFYVDWRLTGNVCESRPVVNPDLARNVDLLSAVSQRAAKEMLSGTYEFQFQHSYKIETAQTVKISDATDSRELDRLEAEHRRTEAAEKTKTGAKKWLGFLKYILAALGLAAVAWFLLLKKRSLALPLALSLASVLYVTRPHYSLFWSYGLWQKGNEIAKIIAFLNLAAIVGWAAVKLWQRLRPKNR